MTRLPARDTTHRTLPGRVGERSEAHRHYEQNSQCLTPHKARPMPIPATGFAGSPLSFPPCDEECPTEGTGVRVNVSDTPLTSSRLPGAAGICCWLVEREEKDLPWGSFIFQRPEPHVTPSAPMGGDDPCSQLSVCQPHSGVKSSIHRWDIEPGRMCERGRGDAERKDVDRGGISGVGANALGSGKQRRHAKRRLRTSCAQWRSLPRT